MRTAGRAPLPIEDFAQAFRFADLAWDSDGETLVWLEGRSARSTLVSWSRRARFARDLTREWSVRAKVGYGGGDFSVRDGSAWFVDGPKLFRQRLDSFSTEMILRAESPLAAPTPSPDGRWITVIESTEEYDRLLLVPAAGGTPFELFAESHFCMQPAWGPGSDQLAWVSWDHPFMPWQESRAMVARLELNPVPRLTSVRELTGTGSGNAAFQPSFSPDGRSIACVSDRSGWFNLELFRAEDLLPLTRWEDEAEHAPPAWVQGMRSYDWMADGRGLRLIRQAKGFSQLVECGLEPVRMKQLEGEIGAFTRLLQPSINRASGSTALIASAPSSPPSILEVSPSGEVTTIRRSLPELIPLPDLQAPEAVAWEDGPVTCRGLLWPPCGPSAGMPKGVIRVHGGPQSEAAVEFDFDVHFFSSLGYWVLDLNYRGSSGYGRDYRRALEGHWGEADVADLVSAARFLSRSRGLPASRIVLSGGSAGGFTILLALARHPEAFRAAVCRYAVTDLSALTAEMPKFERYYLHTLIGPPDECASAYENRSPLNLADRITVPVALFQGEEDKVVPPSQTRSLAESLKSRGVPCLFHLFPGEGHGWRRTETIRRYYEMVEEFLAEHLK